MRRWTICLFGVCIPCAIAHAQPGATPATRPAVSLPLHGCLADYDAEPRRPDGHVDTDALLSRLKELGVNTYYWLIWHAPTDWDDLKLFLPKAAEAKLEVWVYLVPPSESPPHVKDYAEPFRVDYPRWAEEIAKLSRAHANLTAWVIDDFEANRQLFTPAYVRQMQARAKAVNPRLSFLPLMYFPEITPAFVREYGEVIDGVVVAYPPDRAEIERARTVLAAAAATQPGRSRVRVPFVVMTAANEAEFRMRHGDPATPARIAEWLRMSLVAWRDGQCDGVVTYCMPKEQPNELLERAGKLFREYRGEAELRGTTGPGSGAPSSRAEPESTP
jgi:hypothetical protein